MIFDGALKAHAIRFLVPALTVLCVLIATTRGALALAEWAWNPGTDARPHAAATAVHEQAFQTLSDFINRSPGERGQVIAYKSVLPSPLTGKSDDSPRPKGSQRALGKIFEPDIPVIELGLESPTTDFAFPDGAGEIPTSPVPLSDISGTQSGTGFPGALAPGALAIASPSSPAPGGGGGGSDSDPQPPVVAPVPEPQTWLVFIIGFFMSGLLLRSHGSSLKAGRNAGQVAP